MRKFMVVLCTAAAAGLCLSGTAAASAAVNPAAAADSTCHGPVGLDNPENGYVTALGGSGSLVATTSEPTTWCQIAHTVGGNAYDLYRAQGTSLCLTAQTDDSDDDYLKGCNTSIQEQNWIPVSDEELKTEYDVNNNDNVVMQTHGPGEYINTYTANGSATETIEVISQ
jgi:hypothetical protein